MRRLLVCIVLGMAVLFCWNRTGLVRLAAAVQSVEQAADPVASPSPPAGLLVPGENSAAWLSQQEEAWLFVRPAASGQTFGNPLFTGQRPGWRRSAPGRYNRLPASVFSGSARAARMPGSAFLCQAGCSHLCHGTNTPGAYYIYLLRRIVV